MRCRGVFIGLTAALLAASSIMIFAGPAGAASSCNESMNPAAQGNSSGLIVACTFSSAGAGSALTISDYDDAQWHYGAARNVNVTVARTGGTAGTTAGKLTIKSRPTNNAVLASCANSPAGQTGIPAGNLAITPADVNHSIEFALSTATKTGRFIAPGAFIKSVAAVSGSGCAAFTTVTLSKATLAGGPLCPGTTTAAKNGSCTNSVGAEVLVSNDTGRAVTDGHTTAGSNVVTSTTAHFCSPALAGCATTQTDVGKRISGGDLPDGATIASVTNATTVTLACTGCVGGFTGVSTASNQVITLSPADAPTSARYVTDYTSPTGGSRVITSATAEFAKTDIGLPVIFNPAIAAVAGARIGTVAADGSSATIAGAGTAKIPAGAKKFTVGLATKTAPATGDVAGTLAILLQVNPTVSPTSPPCAANKISGFQIPLQWKNPGGYNTVVSAGTNQFSGVSPPGTSIAQFDFNTASTSFAGYLEQHYTTTSSVNGPSSYSVNYTFLPVTVGLCPGTGDATTFNFSGLTVKSSSNPSFTGGGGGGERGILPEPQGTNTTYTGASGAQVTSNATEQPSNTNACNIASPSAIQVGC
jgi:hypothetical protein